MSLDVYKYIECFSSLQAHSSGVIKFIWNYISKSLYEIELHSIIKFSRI